MTTENQKFRTWDNDQNKMYYFDLTDVPLIVAFGAPVMQSSGVTSLSGQEAFVGDIYINPDNPEFKYVVYFSEGAFCGGSNEKNGSPLGWYCENMGVCEIGHPFFEIIGNIYENKELLN